MAEDGDDAIQRWTAKRRAALVVSILKSDTSVAEAARKHGLTVAEIEDWQQRFFLVAGNALRARPKDEEALKDEQIKQLKQKIGELVLDNDLLREALKPSLWPAGRPTTEARRVGRLGTTGLSGAARGARTVRARPPRVARAPVIAEPLATQIQALIQRHPTFRYRRIWAMLRHQTGLVVNRKAVYRVLKLKPWLVHQRPCTPRPRAWGRVSHATRSNQRWAMDVTPVACGRDGWAHVAAVIDCHHRELVGYEFALRGRAKEAERAVEAACLRGFGTLRPRGAPVLCIDNGLIVQSRRFRAVCRDDRLQQEFITPSTPEQNGLTERFFRSLKEKCVWQHNFQSFEEARHVLRRWVHWYNEGRPHQALGYRSPRQFRAVHTPEVA